MTDTEKSPWTSFSSDVLQKFIGQETLEQLNYFLPLLRPKEFDESSLYKKRNLSKIFNSFSGADLLEKQDFRRQFFSSKDDDILNRLSVAIIPNKKKPKRTEIIDLLSNLRWEKNDQTHKLCKILNIDEKLLPDKKMVPLLSISEFKAIYPFKVLKSFQSPVAFQSLDELKKAAVRFVIQMPTGSGKTLVAMEVISRFIREADKGVNILWLAHQKELCSQSFQCFIEVWSHLKNKKLTLYRLWNEGDKTELPEKLTENSFIISNFQKIYSELMKSPEKYNQISKKLDLIIIDEAHKAIAPTYKKVTKTLASITTKIVGLTATPGRSISNEESNRNLSDFFHNNIVSIPEQGQGVISYLRDINILSKATYDPIITEEKIDLSPKQKEYIEKFYELPKELINKLSNSNIRNYEIIKRIDEIIKDNPKAKILFFALSIPHSKFICAVLNTIGINASHVDGDTSLNRRSATLEDFKKGKLNILCNERLMSTGFDAPKTDTIVIAKPTFSIVLYSQIIGRGLRGPEIGGTEYCKIIDVKDNIRGYSDHDLVYKYFDEYFINNN